MMRGVQEVQIPRHGWQQEMLASYQTSSTHTANPPRPNSRVQEFVKLWANAVMQNLAKPKKRVGGSDVEGMEGVKVPEGYSKIAVFEFDDVSPACPPEKKAVRDGSSRKRGSVTNLRRERWRHSGKMLSVGSSL
eukprot:329266-Rhodomonas_salina.1